MPALRLFIQGASSTASSICSIQSAIPVPLSSPFKLFWQPPTAKERIARRFFLRLKSLSPLGGHHIASLLGGGSYGVAVKTIKDGRSYAMKAVADDYLLLRNSQNPSAAALLGREAEILQSVRHPSIPEQVDYFEQRGICFLIQGYVQGNSLAEIIDEGRRFSEAEVRDILSQLLNILCFLHTAENRPAIFHRDLRLSNLILGDGGDLHLIDFGLAYRVGNNADEAFLRAIFSAKSRSATSPTYFMMREDLTVLSDLFGAGVVAVDLFTNSATGDNGKPWEQRIGISSELKFFIRRLLGVEDPFPSSSAALAYLHGLY